ncbi:Homeobox-leucine zipper protein REVOLUTA, partial [Sesbania bispinosa]
MQRQRPLLGASNNLLVDFFLRDLECVLVVGKQSMAMAVAQHRESSSSGSIEKHLDSGKYV